MRITAYSKRWWDLKVQEARTKYSHTRREYKNSLKTPSTQQKLKLARNNYYYIIRRQKRECWQQFLMGSADIIEDNISNEDKNRCWTALKYTSARESSITPAIKALNGDIAITIEEKEAIFLKQAFPEPLKATENIESSFSQLFSQNESISISEKDIQAALFQQSIKKAPGPDRLNFKALRLLWNWDKTRIITLITQCFKLGYHPNAWKIAKGILLKKPNKPDYSIAKAYRVISLLNCLGKVVEKAAATAISTFCEQNELLHEG